MICPFRVGAEFTYNVVYDKEGNKDYIQKEQKAVYPECYGKICPFYFKKWDDEGGCKRAEEEDDD